MNSSNRPSFRVVVVACLTAIAGALLPSPAGAQQVSAGATRAIMSLFVRGVDTAADAAGNYLVVGGQGPVYAACVNAQGVPIMGPVPINATAGGYAAFPRAVYSPHLGAFMVVWAEAPGNPDAMRQLYARAVNCSGGVGAPQLVSATVWWEPGNLAIGYSYTSKRFLVAWQTPEHTVKAKLINMGGAPISGDVLLSPGMGRDPGVTWNPHTDQFGVSFSGETYSAFAIVPAVNPAAFHRNTFNVGGGKLTTMTDVAYNPHTGRYVMAWFEISSGMFARIAEFDWSGNLTSSGVASGRLGSYDALSMAYSNVSGTFLLTGVDRALDTPLGLELNFRGFPFNGENTLSGTRPVRHPRVAASLRFPSWNVVFSGPNFSALSNVIATSFTANGGPRGWHGGPAPAPPGAPPPPPPGGCPGSAPVPGWVCVNGSWLPPDHPLARGSAPPPPPPTPPPAGSCVGAAPVAGWVCVSGNWLPPDHPAARGATPPPSPPPPPPTSSCTTIRPGPDWVCVNGNWLPSTMACPTIQPGPNWRCVNGGWLPPQ
jgi:hypothetical protein